MMVSSSPMPQFSLGYEAELVFIQDGAGRYLSFYWQDADHYGLKPEQIVGTPIEPTCGPVAIAPFLGRVRRVLDYLTPEKFRGLFNFGSHYVWFDLVISPVLMPDGTASTVLVVGQQLLNSPPSLTPQPTENAYPQLLTEIAWNIRRTLDLETIWKQTVDGLGKALEVERCMICPYKPGEPTVRVAAEYHHPDLKPYPLREFKIAAVPALTEALQTLKPVIACPGEDQSYPRTRITDDVLECQVAIATCYQDQPNGILLLQSDRNGCIQWIADPIQRQFFQELADQVGTAIAHASLFAESQSLTQQLQRVNENLMRQYDELEEARKQAEEVSRLKSEFLANTSHELRTPLNGIIGFLKLIMEGMVDDPEEQQEFIEEAHRSALHLLNIINDILDIAKIEAGKMQLELSPVKLDDLLTAVENFTRTQAEQKKLNYKVVTPETRDEVIIYGNYQRLLQVLLNLVGNAIKFTDEGGITIGAEVVRRRVTVENRELPGLVKIRVADTGIGVSLDKQDRLFQSFSQVDGGFARHYGGTGLGLAISQRLVEAMGGTVNFFSMGEGLGSTVTFTVPLYQEPIMSAVEST